MKRRTAVKTGRTAALQAQACAEGPFLRYVVMVDKLASGYVRPLGVRLTLPGSPPLPRSPL